MSKKKETKKEELKVISTITIRHVETQDGKPFIEIGASGIKKSEIITMIEIAKYHMLKQSDV